VHVVRGGLSNELTAQGPHLLKPRCDVAHDRGDTDHPAGIVGKRHDYELDGDPRSILAHRRDRQDLSISVARLSGAHRGAKALPMPLPQPCRDDDVERTAECFRLREAKYTAGTPVPQADDTFGIGVDDSIGNAGHETVGELRRIKLHVSSELSTNVAS